MKSLSEFLESILDAGIIDKADASVKKYLDSIPKINANLHDFLTSTSTSGPIYNEIKKAIGNYLKKEERGKTIALTDGYLHIFKYMHERGWFDCKALFSSSPEWPTDKNIWAALSNIYKNGDEIILSKYDTQAGLIKCFRLYLSKFEDQLIQNKIQ